MKNYIFIIFFLGLQALFCCGEKQKEIISEQKEEVSFERIWGEIYIAIEEVFIDSIAKKYNTLHYKYIYSIKSSDYYLVLDLSKINYIVDEVKRLNTIYEVKINNTPNNLNLGNLPPNTTRLSISGNNIPYKNFNLRIEEKPLKKLDLFAIFADTINISGNNNISTLRVEKSKAIHFKGNLSKIERFKMRNFNTHELGQIDMNIDTTSFVFLKEFESIGYKHQKSFINYLVRNKIKNHIMENTKKIKSIK